MSVQAETVRRSGWVTFAAVIMFAVGFLRVISGIQYLRSGKTVGDLTGSLFGQHLWVWGVWDIAVAVLAIFAGLSLLENKPFGRLIAYVWAVLVIVEGFLIVVQTPWSALGAIALAALVLYGLTVHAPDDNWS
jgi:hypothetical protein